MPADVLLDKTAKSVGRGVGVIGSPQRKKAVGVHLDEADRDFLGGSRDHPGKKKIREMIGDY